LASSCEHIQELLVEHLGETAPLADEQRRHLELCPACCEVAAAERALGLVLAKVLPPADPGMEARVRAGMVAARRRRRMVALLPVAASLLVALLGTLMLGGLPGGSLLALLPVWSSQGWLALAATAGDWGTVVSTAAGATASLLSPGAVAVAAAVSLFGFAAVLLATRRWRQVSPWRRDG
jgi:hypothetical protein